MLFFTAQKGKSANFSQVSLQRVERNERFIPLHPAQVTPGTANNSKGKPMNREK